MATQKQYVVKAERIHATTTRRSLLRGDFTGPSPAGSSMPIALTSGQTIHAPGMLRKHIVTRTL
jgi:hypothetical protein